MSVERGPRAVPVKTKVECVDCAKLPRAGESLNGLRGGVRAGFRPATPAKIHPDSGPRSPRCATHLRAQKSTKRTVDREKRRERTYGIDRDTQLALWTPQGKACPCGRKAGEEPPPGVHLDHDHRLAEVHDHSPDMGCPECVTGFLCTSCNREIVGRLEKLHRSRLGAAEALTALAAFLHNPPMTRLRFLIAEEQSSA